MEEEVTAEMLRESSFDIDIPKYEKWNPGGDRHRRWIKFDVNFYEDPKIMSLTPAQREVFLRLLAARARLGGRIKGATREVATRLVGANGGHTVSYLLKLLKLKLIDLSNFKSPHSKEDIIREDKIRDHQRIPKPASPAKVDRKKNADPPPPPVVTENAQHVIRAFVDAHRSRYGPETTPHIGPKEAGMAKNLLATYNVQQLGLMFQAYVQMEDRFFLAKAHDLPTFCSNLNAVKLALQKGRKNPNEKGFHEYVEELERKGEQRSLPETAR